MKTRFMAFLSTVLIAGLAGGVASAAPVDCTGTSCTVSSGNVTIATDSGDEKDIDEFDVDGVEQISEIEFHLSDGLSNVQDVDLHDTMTLVSATEDEATDQIVVVFENSDRRVTVTYRLQIAGPAAELEASAFIENLSGAEMQVTMLHHADWDLDGTASGDTARYLGSGVFEVVDSTVVRSTSITPVAHFDTAICCENWSGGDLGDSAGPLGPDDIAVEYQYNLTIPDDGSTTVTLIHSVPLGGTTAPAMSIVGLALLVVVLAAVGSVFLPRESRIAQAN